MPASSRKIGHMKRTRIVTWALCFLAACQTWPVAAATFEDIQFWAGTGTNRAGLVIDWKDGKARRSMVWGYRWNGNASGADMLQAVVAADSRLFAHLGQLSWGTAVFGLGYRSAPGGTFGTLPALSFDAQGLLVEDGSTNADDARVPANNDDHYLEGWNEGFWAYYLKSLATEPWASASTGPAGRSLVDRAWDGFSFAANFASSEPAEPVPAASNPFAFEVITAQGPFGPSPYDGPIALLGMPSTNFYDSWGGMSGGTTDRRVKLVEPAYNLDLTQTHKLITTLGEGSSIVVRFEQPITDDPAHPYGIDLLVFGNAFYPANGSVNDGSDMNTLLVTGGVFSENVKVSVSPGYTGAPGQNPTNSATWAWYRFDNGPYADGTFPTQAYRWNRTNATWSSEAMDFTKPVNPVFGPLLEAGSNLSAADVIDLYDGSGGGTGFDLAESGFPSIQYVRVDGLPGFSDGEIDAVSAVRPAVLGDSLTVAPANLTNATSTLRFQHPSQPGHNAVSLGFVSVSEALRVSSTLPDATMVPSTDYGRLLTASALSATPVLGTNGITLNATLRVGVGSGYQGDGSDLVLLRRVEQDWEDVASSFHATAGSLEVPGVTNLFTLALVQMSPPKIRIAREIHGLGSPVWAVRFAALPGFRYALERSSVSSFDQPEEVATISPILAQEATLFGGGLAGDAFYRVRVGKRE